MQSITVNLLLTLVVSVLSISANAQLFGPKQSLNGVSNKPSELQFIDFDNDGDLDLLSASEIDNNLVWYENQAGDLTTQHVISTKTPNAKDAYAADLDGDGFADIVCNSTSQEKVFLFYNNGDKTFTSKRILDNLSASPLDLNVADADGDGDFDIFLGQADKIVWYENLGARNFSTATTITTSVSFVLNLELADLDGDGDVDMAATSTLGYDIIWFENLGGGVFSTANLIEGDAFIPNELLLADMDNDGHVDLLSNCCSNEVYWYKNLGGGSFASGQSVVGPSFTVSNLTLSDFDADGDMDILTVDFSSTNIYFIENLGSGLFSLTPQILATQEYQAEHLLTADANGDGIDDLITGGIVQVYHWENNPTMILTTPDHLSSFVHRPISVETADLDGDGDLDALSGGGEYFYPSKQTLWFDNLGSGNFSREKLLEPFITPNGASAGDLDNDGDMDIIASDYGAIKWLENTGAGNFNAPVSLVTTLNIRAPQAVDLDNDGKLDLLFCSRNENTVLWAKNFGGGNFDSSPNIISSAINGPTTLVAADFDNDGDIDVLSGSFDDNKIALTENLGGGSFGSTVTLSLDGAFHLSAADLDNDGDIDILNANSDFGNHNISWYENLGSGSFGSANLITSELLDPRNVHAADLDNDGDMDVLSASFYDNTIAWYENFGGGSFGPLMLLSNEVTGARDVHTADLDNDGDKDVLAIATLDNQIIWFENLSPNNCINPPTSLSHTYTAGAGVGTLDLVWQAIPEALKYRVKIKRISSAPFITKNFVTTTNSFSLTAPFTPGTVLNWSVRAACASDTTGESLVETISIPSLKSGAKEAGKIALHPNPATESVRIDLPTSYAETSSTAAPFEVHFTDINGVKMHTAFGQLSTPSIEVGVQNWPAGIYFYHVICATNAAGGSFIKE